MRLIVTGAVAGVVCGYVLERVKLCLRANFAGLPDRLWLVTRTWLLGVTVCAVGLTVVYAGDWWPQLNEGLPLRPVHNVLGGAVLGVGIVLALTGASGLFYNLGAGKYTCLVGVAGYFVGDGLGGEFTLPWGGDVLPAGEGATLPGWLGVPRAVVVVPLAVAVVVVLVRRRSRARARPEFRDELGWVVGGVALGLAILAGWILAGIGGHTFGPNTEGAVSSVLRGVPNHWEGAFVLALVPGSLLAALGTGVFRWERLHVNSLLRLFAGGVLVGVGGQIAGGCNLGHGVTGATQLGISSWLVVAAIVAGIALGRRLLVDVEHELERTRSILG